MKKNITGMERDFLLETLIKKSIPLICENNAHYSIKIIGKNEHFLQAVLQSEENPPPQHGIYTTNLDAIRTISMELSIKSAEHPLYTFLLPHSCELIEKHQEKARQPGIQLLCSFENDTLSIASFAKPKHNSSSCKIFPDLHAPDPSVFASFSQNNTIARPLPQDVSHYPVLASISKATDKVLLFDYKQGIPEKDYSIGTKLITRDEFEHIVANATKEVQNNIKEELKNIAQRKKTLCLYPQSIFSATNTDVMVWELQNISHKHMSEVLHILDAINLALLCAHTCTDTMIAGIFIHGFLICIDKQLTNNISTCLLSVEKRNIRGTVKFEPLFTWENHNFYYGKFFSIEPEDFRFLADYIRNNPLTDADFESEEVQSICSL